MPLRRQRPSERGLGRRARSLARQTRAAVCRVLRGACALAWAAAVAGAGSAHAEEIACPSGTQLRGSPPPGGHKQWCALPDGTQHGPSVFWYASGRKRVSATFRQGKLHGTYREWYADGTLKEEGGYQEDARTGVHRTWHPNGARASEEAWKAGRRDGPSTAWYESGGKLAEQHYRRGRRHGPAATWYESGQLQTRGQFEDGVYDGAWRGWWEDGSLRKAAEFEGGRELSREFHEKGAHRGDAADGG